MSACWCLFHSSKLSNQNSLYLHLFAAFSRLLFTFAGILCTTLVGIDHVFLKHKNVFVYLYLVVCCSTVKIFLVFLFLAQSHFWSTKWKDPFLNNCGFPSWYYTNWLVLHMANYCPWGSISYPPMSPRLVSFTSQTITDSIFFSCVIKKIIG